MQRGCDSVSIVVGVEYLRESIHPRLFSPGRCHARWVLRAFPKGRDGPQLRFSASWEKPTPTSFDVAPVGTCPHGRRLFLALFSGDATRASSRGLVTRTFERRNSCTFGEHASVF